MRCFHNDIIFDDEYIRDCYPITIASHNRGRLCPVAKSYFAVGINLLQKIHEIDLSEKLKKGDRDAIKHLYESLLNDSELSKHFIECVETENSGMMQHKNIKEVWKYLLTKTYHARIGVITDSFADATTGQFSATAKTDPLRAVLKIQTRQKTIEKVKSRLSGQSV